MQLLNKLQPLFSSSALFKDQNKSEEPQEKGKGKGRRGKWKEQRVKMGQGGTLDPLADGVLGNLFTLSTRPPPRSDESLIRQ